MWKCEKANKDDFTALAALCGPCFDEGAGFTGPFLDYALWRGGEVFCVRREGAIVSMAASLPFSISIPSPDGGTGSLPARYLYALCTEPKWRGHGFAHAVVEKVVRKAAEDGCVAVALQPENAALADRYLRQGFVQCAARTECVVTAERLKATGTAALEVRRCSFEKYAELREKALRGSVHAVFPPVHLGLAKHFFADNGSTDVLAYDDRAGFFKIGDSLAAAEITHCRLTIHELIAQDGERDAALATLARHLDMHKSEVRLRGPDAGEGTELSPLMALWLDAETESRLGGAIPHMPFTLE